MIVLQQCIIRVSDDCVAAVVSIEYQIIVLQQCDIRVSDDCVAAVCH